MSNTTNVNNNEVNTNTTNVIDKSNIKIARIRGERNFMIYPLPHTAH